MAIKELENRGLDTKTGKWIGWKRELVASKLYVVKLKWTYC